jgi:hypothetical protein
MAAPWAILSDNFTDLDGIRGDPPHGFAQSAEQLCIRIARNPRNAGVG